MLYNLNRSAPSKRTRLQSVLYNLHRSASSKSTRSERKQQLDVLPVQSSDVKDLLRWPAGAALLSSTRLDLFCGAFHCLVKPFEKCTLQRSKPHIPSPRSRRCFNSAAAKIRATENSPAIRSGDHRTNDSNQFRNIVSPYFKCSERFLENGFGMSLSA